MAGVWLVVALGSEARGAVAYIHPEGAEIGSMEDDGIQDHVIDQLFPPGGFDTQTKLIDIAPNDTEHDAEFGDDFLFTEFS
jgi:hypothetical protein